MPTSTPYKLSPYSANEVAWMDASGQEWTINPQSREWPAYQAWLAAGNVPLPAKVRPVVDPATAAGSALVRDPAMRGLIAVIAVKLGMTPAQLIAAIKAAA